MPSPQLPDFDAVGTKVLSPVKLAHVVLRTANLKPKTRYYVDFLGGKITHGNEVLSFISYDEEHHRVALIGIPDTQPKVSTSCGLEHVAFTFNTLADLAMSYRQRKAKGISPVWSVNHGPTTSIYYRDPDGNMLETQVDNFDNLEEANAFMASKHFAENPIGTDFDPEELIEKLRNGANEKQLKIRHEIGPREMPDLTAL
ncbi:glyoxalase/Bleomycin resistance protein/Dioxygenase [Stagonosporopsis vannaccii]|nr:glyoxalase/Bleomycin resistance protein/Dioxygenase [Stagonosporopsis vannaccii]